MEVLDIVLINIICYMSGIMTGIGVCLKYKKHLLIKASSQEQLSQLVNSINTEIGNQHLSNTYMGPPIIASAPSSILKEVVIRTTE